jgi:hypothetical protein
VLWLGCAGVGSAIIPARSWRGPDDPEASTPTWHHLGTVACIGLAALIAVGGAATVLRVPPLLAAGLFVVAGLVLLAARATSYRAPMRRQGHELICVFVLAGVGACALVIQASVSIAAWPNGCDDLLAYIPFADRLLATSQIIEPWSMRRLQSLGGQTFLQAIPIGTLGHGAFDVTERLTATTFLAGIFVAAGFRRLRSLVACIAIVLVLAVLVVPRVSSAAVLLVVPLLVAGFGTVSEMRTSLPTAATGLRWAVAAGLLLAGVVALRIHVGPTLAAVVAMGLLTARSMPLRNRWWALGTAGGTAALALIPWGIASWLSSGTPAYPFIGGNANPEVPASQDPALHGVRAIAARAVDLIQVGPYLGAAVAVLVVALVAHRWLPDGWFVVIAAGAVLLNMAVLARVLTVSEGWNFARYTSPMSIALVLFFAYEAVRGSETPAAGGFPPMARPFVLLAAAALILGHVAFLFTSNGATVVRNSIEITRATLADGGQHATFDLFSGWDVQDDYSAALDLAAGGGPVIAAVDRPYLIDYGRHDDIRSLDLPGWAAPGGDFPFFQGAAIKLGVLRRQGYSQLLVTVPERHICLAPDAVRAWAARTGPAGSAIAPFFLDWSDSVAEIVETAPRAVRRVGSLLLIDLEAAERALLAAPR